MKHLLILILISSSIALNAQDLAWAKAFYSSRTSFARHMDVDSAGNVYITGQFWDTVDLDPGSGIYNIGTGNTLETFIVKLDMDGNFIWGKQLSDLQGGQSYPVQILLDNAGGIFITGYFKGTVDLDPGQNTFDLVADSTDIFILKLDHDGNFNWAKKIGGIHDDVCVGMVMDHSGDLYLLGQYKGTVDFDPGAGVADLTASSNGVYIAKFDGEGNYIWAQSVGTNGTYYFAGNIAVDLNNNICITTTIANDRSTYLLKYDSSGALIWTKEFVVDAPTARATWNGLATDAIGNIFSTGSISGTIDFDPGVGVNNLIGNDGIIPDVFIVKLNPDGDLVWAKEVGGSGSDNGNNVMIDDQDDLYVSGTFQHTVDLDPGIDTFNLTGPISGHFILKLSNDGDFEWAGQIGGDLGGSTYIQQLDLDIAGNVYAAGTFSYGSVDLDPSETGVSIFTPTGSSSTGNGFIIKLSPTPVPDTSSGQRQAKTSVYPNPSNGTINISSETTIDKIIVRDIFGKPIYEASPNEQQYEFTPDIAPGIYYINITSGNNSYLKKIVFLK